jgi:hypothetical protein
MRSSAASSGTAFRKVLGEGGSFPHLRAPEAAGVTPGKWRKLTTPPGVRVIEMTRSTDPTGLLLAVLIAEDLAAAGRAADGYTALLDGLRRVRKNAEEEDPLVRRWRWSVEEFAARWSIGRA